MADKNNLAEMIATEEERLKKLENKRNEVDKKIKTSRENLAKYKLLYNNYCFSELSNALDNRGIGIDDIIAAIQSGDLKSIQDKLSKGETSD